MLTLIQANKKPRDPRERRFRGPKIASEGARSQTFRARRIQISSASTLAYGVAGAEADKVAAIALANKIARMAWAMMAKGERYREPVALAA